VNNSRQMLSAGKKCCSFKIWNFFHHSLIWLKDFILLWHHKTYFYILFYNKCLLLLARTHAVIQNIKSHQCQQAPSCENKIQSCFSLHVWNTNSEITLLFDGKSNNCCKSSLQFAVKLFYWFVLFICLFSTLTVCLSERWRWSYSFWFLSSKVTAI